MLKFPLHPGGTWCTLYCCFSLMYSSLINSNGVGFCLVQVHSTSKKLLYQLDHLVQICNQPGMDPPRKHVCQLVLYGH